MFLTSRYHGITLYDNKQLQQHNKLLECLMTSALCQTEDKCEECILAKG